MTSLSLRARFALLAAVLSLAIASLVGLIGYLSFRSSVLDQAGREARDQAHQLRSLIDTGSGGPNARPDQGGNQVSLTDSGLTHEFARSNLIVAVYRTDGRQIGISSGHGLALPAATRSKCLLSGETSVRLARPAMQVTCDRVGPAGRPVGMIAVGAPLAGSLSSLATLRDAVLIAIGIGIGIAGLLAFAMAHRALRPVRGIAETADRIRSGDLSQRIDYAGPADELGQLAANLDMCFAELEEAMDRQHQFVADASHQLKTPIAAMRAHVELLQRWAATSPVARGAALSSLDQAARGAGRVVADLLYLAGLEQRMAPSHTAVRLDQVVLGAVGEAAPLRTEVPIRVERLDDAETLADELRLRQLLLNVLDNALRVSPPADEVLVSLSRAAKTARIEIADRGPGIPPDQLEAIFERFRRGSNGSGTGEAGSGLGLAIARAIAEESGARLWAENRQGGGAIFIVELPLSDSHQIPISASRGSHRADLASL